MSAHLLHQAANYSKSNNSSLAAQKSSLEKEQIFKYLFVYKLFGLSRYVVLIEKLASYCKCTYDRRLLLILHCYLTLLHIHLTRFGQN